MGKKNKVPGDRRGTECLYRSAELIRDSADDDARSMPLVLASETPVDVVDVNRMAVIKETLQLDGMELPNHVPLLDNHDRTTLRSVLGSIRDFEVRDGKLHGRVYFARDPESQRAYDNYRDGHLTDFSVGAAIRDGYYDDNGDRIITRSRLLEGSAVVAGQDPNAKVMTLAMRAYVDPHALKDELMDTAIRNMLIKRGLPEDATDDDALKFLEDSLSSTVDEEEEVVTVATTSEPTTAEEPETTETPQQEPESEPAMTVTDTAAVAAAERTRIKEVDEICRSAQIPDDIRTGWIDDPEMTPEKAALAVIRRGHARGDTPIPRIEGGKSEREKFCEAAHNGFVARTAQSAGLDPQGFLSRVKAIEEGAFGKPSRYHDQAAVQRNKKLSEELAKPAPGADEFQYASLPDIARMFLERAGQRTHGLPKHEICRRAIALPSLIERGDQATNTTGSFANLMLDAANKTLLAGYDEAEHTYSMWVRMAPSAADFKQLHRIRFGELADPEVIPENMPYPEKATSDAKESYGVEKYGEIFSISLEAVVNDDLNAIMRIPQMQGFAMRRKINKVCYAVLTANEALSDNIALFHATSHGENLDATALSETALDTGFTVMGTQTGLSGSGTPLGITPSYLIVPAALAATAFRLVTGGVVPTSSGSNVPLYGAGRVRPLTVIPEPQLDSNSTTGWYLAANSGAVETVELTFLQGEESPVLEREEGFATDTVKYKIRQTFAAKAIDYRGLYQGNG